MTESSPTRELILAVDLGGTKTAVSLWRGCRGTRPRRVSKERWPTLKTGPEPNLELIVVAARRLVAAEGLRFDDVDAVGVSAGGPVDVDAETIVSIPNLAGWQGVSLARQLESALGVPVSMQNDAKACALAEWRFGAGRGASDLVFLTCSTGIGAGVISGGCLLHGAANLAGEVGHLEIVADGLPCGCGRRGCLEAYASGAGMAQRLRAEPLAVPKPPFSARDVVALAKTGCREAEEFLHTTADYLAVGLAHVVYCFNPQRIILGTIVVGAGELLLARLRSEVTRRVWPELASGLEILPAALGDDLGDLAAVAVVGMKPELG